MRKFNVLKSTKQRFFNKRIFGFDIETYDDNKKFLMASIIGENYKKFFYSPEEIKNELRSNKCFRDSYIFATNLSFDFFGVFYNDPNFKSLFRGSDLLSVKTYFNKGDFYPFYKRDYETLTDKKKGKTLKGLTFVDTLNYAKLSVEKMGEIMNIKKLDHPSFLGEHPKSKSEWEIMKNYNERDSIITFNFAKFLIKSFEKLGASFKLTLASTSMSLFKNKYLKGVFFQPEQDKLIEQFKSYYGGRTESFKRGYFENHRYYDFNSLYPSVMRDNIFPDPNSLRITHDNTLDYINDYEGCSDVEIYAPYMKYPILPVRLDNGRVIFPYGNLRGWYCHNELRYAIENGYIIKRVHKTQYFKEICSPFKDYVNDLYNLRLEFQKDNNPMEYVVKITMNSLYGKFGQRFLDKDNWVHESSITFEQLEKMKSVERKGNYMRVVKDCSPSAFCIPIWASYVTSYGRIKLHQGIVKTNPIYCDTDSLITSSYLENSTELGHLKLETTINRGVVVRPKFYAFEDINNKEHIKIKGLGVRLDYLQFLGLLVEKRIEYNKFAKFKEALRRDLIPNQIILQKKEFGLEDEKRLWEDRFNVTELQDSEPIDLDAYNTEKDLIKINELMDKRVMERDIEIINDDNFDKHSVGKDISYIEFLNNERCD